jgi:hypothetical protein
MNTDMYLYDSLGYLQAKIMVQPMNKEPADDLWVQNVYENLVASDARLKEIKFLMVSTHLTYLISDGQCRQMNTASLLNIPDGLYPAAWRLSVESSLMVMNFKDTPLEFLSDTICGGHFVHSNQIYSC